MPQRALLLLLLCLGVCLGKIEHATVTRDNRLLIQLAEPFGFGAHGHLNITLKDVGLYPKVKPYKPDPDRMGFILMSPLASLTLDEESARPNRCPLHSMPKGSGLIIVKRFSDSVIADAITGKTSVTLSHGYAGAQAFLFFANCDNETLVSFKATVVTYNVDASGHINYLSVGQAELSTLYWVMLGAFTAIAAAWAWLLYTCKDQAHKIHYLVLALVIIKALTLLCQAGEYHFLAVKGQTDGWNIAYYIFTFARGVLFFVMVVLVGTGWSHMKLLLGELERTILMVIIPVQVFANIAIIITDEESPAVHHWLPWNDIFHSVDILCCCAILRSIIWFVEHLREAAQVDDKAARNMGKLTLFRRFYVMVVVYIYFTRILMYWLESQVDYRYKWVGDVANQLVTLAFYVWTGISFRPHKESAYYRLHAVEEEDDIMILLYIMMILL